LEFEIYFKFILSFALILIAARIGGEVAERYLKQPQILGELVAGIAHVLAGDDPVLCRIEVRRDHSISPKVQAMKLPDGGMVSKPLEDMWPHLPPEELAENMRFSADD